MRSSTFQDPHPQNRCRARGSGMKTPLLTMLTVFLMSLFLQVNSAQAQNLYTQCTGCTSEDIKATSIRFDPASGASCLNPDQTFGATLYVGLDVTSNTRYGLYIEFEIWVNGAPWPSDDPVTRWQFCVKQDLPQGQYEVEIGEIPGLPGGSTVELKNVFTGWENQDPDIGGGDGTYFCDISPLTSIDCSDVDKPRCKTYLSLGETVLVSKPTITVTGPESVCAGTTGTNFVVSGTASTPGAEIELYYSFTGGAPYTKVDNFDGSENIPANSPFTVSQTLTAYLVRVATGEPDCPGDADAHTITSFPAATVEAGPNKQYCSTGMAVALEGSYGGGATSAMWSGGAGSFSNANSPTSTYTPTAGEVTAGSVTLTLTTNDPEGPCPAVSDWMVVNTFTGATVDAGDDQTVCSDDPDVVLDGSFGGGASSATWTGGAGVFSPNANTPTATYTPTAGEIEAGSVTLTLTTNDPTGPCGVVSETMVINIDEAATVDAGDDQSVCSDDPEVTLDGSFGGGASSASWSGGGGVFNPNNTTMNATYTPSAAEIEAGSVTLTLTSNNPEGPCGVVSETMVITIYEAAEVSAGPDKDACAASPDVMLGGSYGGGASSATWTGGAGVFNPNANSPTATYTPTAGEITAGSVTLTLTTNNPTGPCGPVSDWMVVTIYPNSEADAGDDFTICADGTAQLDASSTPAAGSWSGGAGSYAPNSSDPNAVYNPTVNEEMAGSVTLTWTTVDPAGPCTSASDAVIITINPIATVDAGDDQTVCSDDPEVTLDGSYGGGATSASWTGGAGSFNPNNSSMTAVYTPTAGEIAAGSVTLTLITNDPVGPCGLKSDWMVITINPAATADAGDDQTVCADETVQLDGTYGGGASSGMWSGGGGSYNPSAAAGDAVYTPSAGEKMAGSVTLTWTTDDPAGICGTDADHVVITINPIATVEAGNPQTTCVGVGVTLTAVLGGSATSVTWSAPSGTFLPNATANPVTYIPSASGPINVTATTNDPVGTCDAATDIVVVTANTCEAGYCTYTQGGFGQLGGKDSYKNAAGACVKSQNAIGTITAALDGWGAAGMQVSNMNFKSTNAGDVQLIIDYLPNGGPSKAYTGTKANLLTAGNKNTLLAQTMTLGLNLGLNPTLKAFTLENGWLVTSSSDDCGETPDGLSTQCFQFSVVSAMNVNGIAGVQVEDIWILANQALRGEALPAGVSMSALAGAADAVNNAFDECRVPLRWSERDECVDSRNSLANLNTESFGSAVNSSTEMGKELTVKAYPNPFKDRVFFRFTSPVSGKATVEIFDMTGRRLEVINKGQVIAGRENTVEYTVPSFNRNSIIYRVSVDKFSVNGRLISPGINR